jgi:hypothetical protein
MLILDLKKVFFNVLETSLTPETVFMYLGLLSITVFRYCLFFRAFFLNVTSDLKSI